MKLTVNHSLSSSVPLFRVLIAYVDQLHDFVQQVPPLAWELLDYAQEPLEIIYPRRKFVMRDDANPSEICVRWVKHPRLLSFLKKEGPVWATPAVATSEDEVSSFRLVDCYNKKYPYKKVRTMRVNDDNTFTFIR